MTYLPVALTIAKVTLVGGAGIMARFKVIQRRSVYGMASGENDLVAQNTRSVQLIGTFLLKC